MLALYIERGSRLEEITVRKLLKHCFVVLRIVTGDMSDLENQIQLYNSKAVSTYLRHNLDVVAHFVKCLAKTCSIVSCIHLYEAKQCLPDGPLSRCRFFDPVASDSEYASALLACHASHVRLTSPIMVGP